ncbi:MAG: glycosyltransferase, partial [Candidatus Sericytochromatia bacterium]|nr:glycosyltransferase [Candidatus Sericytochromatia bacterium]
MDNKKSPLLSIVIPTKNRQYTCLYVIETCLLIKNNDIEIIVQDCSDSNILQKQITNKFENDSRILYQFDGTKPSMTDNWNKGYENSSGKYIIGIGDDDGILPEIYEIANWADRHSFEVVGHTEPYNYLWPDYPIKHYQGSLIARNFNSSIQYIDDLKARVKLRSKYADMGYAIDLPMVYHRLISR